MTATIECFNMAGRNLCDTVVDNADAASMKVVRLCMLSSNK